MSYFEDIMTLPTVEVVQHLYSPQSINKGLLAKLKTRDADTVTVIAYAPDLGYEVRGSGMEDSADYLTLTIPANAVREVTNLTKLDEYVIASMLRHPSIFPTREAVLSHTFLVLGNGLEWNSKGVLADRGGRPAKTIEPRKRMSYINASMEAWPMKDLFDRISDKLPDDEKEYAETRRVEAFAEHLVETAKTNASRARRELFIDYYATTRSRYNITIGYYENPINIADLVESKYLPLANIPAVADRSFLDGAVEILKKAISSAEGTYRHNPHLNRPVDPDMPDWVSRAALIQATANPKPEMTDEHKAKVAGACGYIEDLIQRITTHKNKTGWAYVSTAQNAFKAVGWKKSVYNASNGTGWCGVHAPRPLSDDDITLIERRMARKGFEKSGLTWTKADWHVTVSLVPVGDMYRGQILIITHPEDDQKLIDTMQRTFDTGWLQSLRYNAIRALCYHQGVSTEEAAKIADDMGEIGMAKFTDNNPMPKDY